MSIVIRQPSIDAVQLLAPVMRRTPVVASRVLSERCGHDVWLKCENLQRTGSFKPRGAYIRIAGLTVTSERANGVVAASAGNHAQGVAWLRPRLWVSTSRVYMPTGASLPEDRRDPGLRRRGGSSNGTTVDESPRGRGQTIAEETGAVLIHPFDHIPTSWPGRPPSGSRSSSRCPTWGPSLVPLGGGGLLAGWRPRSNCIGRRFGSSGYRRRRLRRGPNRSRAGSPGQGASR